MAKFRHLDKKINVYLVFGKILILLWQTFFMLLGNISLLPILPILGKIIWSRWFKSLEGWKKWPHVFTYKCFFAASP